MSKYDKVGNHMSRLNTMTCIIPENPSEHIGFLKVHLYLHFFRTRGDFNFDDAVSNRFGCEVHSFDPGYVNKGDASLILSQY